MSPVFAESACYQCRFSFHLENVMLNVQRSTYLRAGFSPEFTRPFRRIHCFQDGERLAERINSVMAKDGRSAMGKRSEKQH
jgi:hypothetical protein